MDFQKDQLEKGAACPDGQQLFPAGKAGESIFGCIEKKPFQSRAERGPVRPAGIAYGDLQQWFHPRGGRIRENTILQLLSPGRGNFVNV